MQPVAPCGLVILITGPPASGKSTLAQGIATTFGIPMLSKDTVKERLADTTSWSPKDLGIAAERSIIDEAMAMARSGRAVVTESTFRHPWSTADITAACVREAISPPFAQIVLTGRSGVLTARFRDRSPARHSVHHVSDEALASLVAPGRFTALPLPGPSRTIDTTAGTTADTILAEVAGWLTSAAFRLQRSTTGTGAGTTMS